MGRGVAGVLVLVCGAEAELWHDVTRELWASQPVNQTIRLAAVRRTLPIVARGSVVAHHGHFMGTCASCHVLQLSASLTLAR